MLFENKTGVQINCQKINYSTNGVSIVKVSVSHKDKIKNVYALMPTNINYSNDHAFFKSIIEPIVNEYEKKSEDISLSFSKNFPLLESISYRSDRINSIKDDVVVNKINEIKNFLEEKNIKIEGYAALKDESSYNRNREFEAVRNISEDISVENFNTIILENNFIKRYGKEKENNSINILQKTNKDNEKVYFIDFLDAKGKVNNKKIIKFKNEEEREDYFSNLFNKISELPNKTIIYNNDPYLLKYKNEKFKMVKKNLNESDEKILRILDNRRVVNFYNGSEYLPSVVFRILNDNVNYELNREAINIYAPLSSVKNKIYTQELKDDFKDSEIGHFLIGRLKHEECENIFALVTENTKDLETGNEKIKIKTFGLDLKIGETDEEVFKQFNNLCENKLGKKLSEFKSDRTQLIIDNFEERPDFVWSIKNKLDNNIINLGFEEKSPYLDIFENYIINNENNIEQRNRLLASNNATDENTLCVYVDASMLPDQKHSMTYGAVIREPNGDSIIKEIKGIREFKDHMNDTIAAEEIAIIEALKSIKIMMDRDELPKGLNLEFRLDNIHAAENFFEKDGRNNKIEEFSSSDLYSKKEVNELLSYFEKIDVRWTRGHCNNKYNERVDKVAKSAWKLLSSYGYKKDKHKKMFSENNRMFEDVKYKNELAKQDEDIKKKRNNYGI